MVVETKGKVSGRSAERVCPECGKIVHGGGGLYGHLLMAHGIRQPRRETRLALELQQAQADIVWRDTTITNLKKEIVELKQKCGIWDECPNCGMPYSMHQPLKVKIPVSIAKSQGIELRGEDEREFLVCPTERERFAHYIKQG
jgi:hypothetical protein